MGMSDVEALGSWFRVGGLGVSRPTHTPTSGQRLRLLRWIVHQEHDLGFILLIEVFVARNPPGVNPAYTPTLLYQQDLGMKPLT